MTNYEHIKDLDKYGMTKFLVLLQTAQIIPLKYGCNCINCTHCKQNYICFKKWLDNEDEQMTLYNQESEEINMTIKELKEQINKNQRELSKFEKEVIESNVLNLFNENLKVEQIIQNKFIFVSMIRHFYKKYDNTLDKESKKFINYIITRYPHLMFDYEIIDKNTAEIKYQYIFNNELKKGSIKYQKGDISILCYDTYLSQILQDIGAEMEKEINNNNTQQPAIKLAISNLKR